MRPKNFINKTMKNILQFVPPHQFKAGSATPTGGSHPSSTGTVSSKKVLNKLLHMIRGSSSSMGANHLPPSADDVHLHNHVQLQQQQQQMVDSADEVCLNLEFALKNYLW
jgi:hypothetical protein